MGDPLLAFMTLSAYSDEASLLTSNLIPKDTSLPFNFGNRGQCLVDETLSSSECFLLFATAESLGRSFWPFGPYTFVLEEMPGSLSGEQRQLGYQGSFYNFVIYFNVTLVLIMLVMSTSKLYLFLHVQEKFALTLPIIILGLCVLASFFSLFNTVFFTSNTAAPQEVLEGLQLLVWPLLWTACIVLGFYFGDVSMLTSSSSTSRILGKMVVPAVAVLFLVWGLFLGLTIYVTFLGAGDTNDHFFESLAQGNSDVLVYNLLVVRAAASFSCVIVCVAIVLFGGISIFLSSSGMSSEGRKTIIAISGLSLFITLVIGGLGLFYWSNYFTFNNVGWSPGFTDLHRIAIWELMVPILHHFLIVVALCFTFRISVDKEIEMSKSGTSSTSSSSSSSLSSSNSSSSSSSSTRDPVIEL